ncbi:hypothetical protein F0L68_29570 [Solihabitans fulvus]|uniref:Uncharacterized protein n=1 Tax=Solihabitans fulvus TaxID=1892852 RepID=A0A5B2WV66_9PSEU|nr:hypothetical protein [Solihabitans fulvus]KAA2254928.1 hypothetical protein F0L68_29570 [Solihabitans fulvus]
MNDTAGEGDGGAGATGVSLTEERFAELAEELVTFCAPRLFAVVEEEGEFEDASIVAWGMAFERQVHTIASDGSLQCSFPSVERAERFFGRGTKIRLVWPTLAATA